MSDVLENENGRIGEIDAPAGAREKNAGFDADVVENAEVGASETPSFQATSQRQPISLRSVFAGFIEYPKESLIVVVIQASGVQFYLWMVFLPTYANISGGLPIADGLLGGMISLAFYTAVVSPLAALSDRIGRSLESSK